MMDPVQDTSADGSSPGRGRQQLVARLVLAGIVVLVLLVGGDSGPQPSNGIFELILGQFAENRRDSAG